MAEILQTSNDYKIKTRTGGEITLDVGSASSGGTVKVTGNLLVEGDTTTVESQQMTIEDNIITLNKGEAGNGVTLGVSGIEIDRGFSAPSVANPLAVFRFNETDNTWEIIERNVSTVSFNNSAIKVKKIATDSFTDGGDLTLIGAGTGVVKVDGTTNYHLNVSGDDDIPNKKYVDVAINVREPLNRIQRDDTYVIVQDTSGGAAGNVIMAIGQTDINSKGTGYAPGDELILNEGTRIRDARLTVDTVDGVGGILTFTVSDSGLFSALPTSRLNVSTITNNAGNGATFDLFYNVSEVELTNAGNDYQSVTVSFTDNGGQVRVATATASIDLDPNSPTFRQIETVTVTDGGNYTDIPSVVFSAGINASLPESQAQVVVDGNIVATFYSNRSQLGDLEVLGNTISNNNTNENIVLRTQGTAAVEIPRALQFNYTGEVVPHIVGATLVYGDLDETVSAEPSTGGTGLYFSNSKQTLSWQEWATNNSDTNINGGNLTAYPPKNELISKQRALAFSMLF